MIIGVPTEIKTREFRVGINPGGVAALTRSGHQVHIQKGAGLGSGITDAEFTSVGAKIVPTAADAWAAEMVMKVKEPLESEVQYFREGQILYTYLHLAPLPELTRQLMEKKVRAIAYETVENADGSLPLLRPMSEVAGRMATQVGATSLEKERGGRGVLLGGVPGTRRGHVTILGGGIVGSDGSTPTGSVWAFQKARTGNTWSAGPQLNAPTGHLGFGEGLYWSPGTLYIASVANASNSTSYISRASMTFADLSLTFQEEKEIQNQDVLLGEHFAGNGTVIIASGAAKEQKEGAAFL